MSTVLNYLSATEFADDRLTAAINIPPYQTGRAAQLGIFVDTPIHTTYVRLGVEEEELTLIPARERGGPANLNMRNDPKKGVDFDIPHFPLDDAISPSDIQNLTAFSSDYIMESLETVYAQKLESIRGKHDVTHSYLDWGALNGLVLDGEGKELFNLYQTFGLTENALEFGLDDQNANLSDENRAAKAIIRKELRGAPSTGVRILAGGDFFDKYVSHASVERALAAYPGQTANPARDDVQDTFTFAGVTLERIDEEYKFRLPNGQLVTRKAVAADEAIMLPLGTQFFRRYIAPPDTLSGANRRPAVEQKVHISTEDLPHDKGRHIHSESNVLPICTRPQLMIRLTIKP